MQALLRALFLALVRLFYPRIDLRGVERIPATGPALVLANHPNGLLDPLVIRLALGRPVAFLAKSTLFGNPFGRTAMAAFDAIPVFRPKDGADTSKNEETFERCRKLLRAHGWLAMFPEGVSHSDPLLKPLKTGAARIALSAEAAAAAAGEPPLGLQIVPIGLLFEEKHVFRSRVAVTVGAPFAAAAAGEDERARTAALTEKIHAALADVVLEAESRELWRGLLAVAAWTAAPADLAASAERAQALAAVYRRLSAADPERAGRIVESVRAFVRTLQSLGIEDPLDLESDSPVRRGIVASAAPLLALAPAAAIGALIGWLPYRIVRPLAVRIARGEEDIIGTIKLILGLVAIGAWYVAIALGVAFWVGWPQGAALLVLGPATGFAALRFDERLSLRRRALRAWWLRATSVRVAEAVRRERESLAARVNAELTP